MIPADKKLKCTAGRISGQIYTEFILNTREREKHGKSVEKAQKKRGKRMKKQRKKHVKKG